MTVKPLPSSPVFAYALFPEPQAFNLAQVCLFLMYGGSQTAQLASVIAEHNLELLIILVDRPHAGMTGVSHHSNFLFLNIK